MVQKALKWFAFGQAVALAAASCHPDTVHFPLNYKYGMSRKVSTDLVVPGSNETVEVCFDQGSEMFWVFGPETEFLWGARFPPGPCAIPVGSPNFDYTQLPGSPTPQPMAESWTIGYGGGARLLFGNTTITDSLTFTSAAGESSSIPNITVAMASAHFYSMPTEGNCSPSEMLDRNIDRGILGVAKYIRSPEYNSTEPSVRQDLLDRGMISNKVQSIWFDEAPKGVTDTFTGGALLGGIDTSKFRGPLVKVPSLVDDEFYVGYYIEPPRVSVNGIYINQTGFEMETCHLDSGTINDALPITSATERMLLRVAGLVKSTNDNIAWPGTCDSVPRTTTIDLTFAGVDRSESVTIKVPLRNYVRQDDGTDIDEDGNVLCRLNLYSSEDYGRCVFGAPFSTAGFFAADDEANEIALAQGGVAPRGSGPDNSRIIATIPSGAEFSDTPRFRFRARSVRK